CCCCYLPAIMCNPPQIGQCASDAPLVLQLTTQPLALFEQHKSLSRIVLPERQVSGSVQCACLHLRRDQDRVQSSRIKSLFQEATTLTQIATLQPELL